ncbi:MAG: type VII toxin-antitoxin system MntA family adenylyltransferase antitoxin [Chitinispirillaceae bacterium]
MNGNGAVKIWLSGRYENRLKQIISSVFGKECGHTVVYLFGSRARGDCRVASDIDLAVETDYPAAKSINALKNELIESTIPYEVDVVDLQNADDSLKRKVLIEGVVVWKK